MIAMTVAHVLQVGISVVVVAAVVIGDHFLPDSAEVELAKWYRGQRKRREKRGHTH